MYGTGGMAERSKAAVLKTVNRKVRGFESCSLRHFKIQYSPKKYRNPLETAGFFVPFVFHVRKRPDEARQ